MGSRNKQVYFLIMYYHFSTLRYKGLSLTEFLPVKSERLGQVEWSTRNTSV